MKTSDMSLWRMNDRQRAQEKARRVGLLCTALRDLNGKDARCLFAAALLCLDKDDTAKAVLP